MWVARPSSVLLRLAVLAFCGVGSAVACGFPQFTFEVRDDGGLPTSLLDDGATLDGVGGFTVGANGGTGVAASGPSGMSGVWISAFARSRGPGANREDASGESNGVPAVEAGSIVGDAELADSRGDGSGDGDRGGSGASSSSGGYGASSGSNNDGSTGNGRSGDGGPGSSSGAGSSSSGGAGSSSSGGPIACACSAGQPYPTGINCSAISLANPTASPGQLRKACNQTAGFLDPTLSCGQQGVYATCAAVDVEGNVVCQVASLVSATQQCLRGGAGG